MASTCSTWSPRRRAADVEIRELAVPNAYEVTPVQHGDERGTFLEWFRESPFEAATGHPLPLRQANLSVSRQGSVRGVHFADVPPGQAKYVTCVTGAALDVVVDLRVGSPTFGRWDSVLIDDLTRRAVYVAEGLGHAFMALSEWATVAYLCSEGYAPEREHGVHPLDPALGIEWPADVPPLLSAKDAAAPGLQEATASLPSYEQCIARYRSLAHPL
jgi:dTDP-4-dehydrorhamnose 3,5-epimerase